MSVSVVTGAAGGLGSAISERLTAQGDTVVPVDRDGETVEAVAARINDSDVTGSAYGWTSDVASDEANIALAARVRDEFGELDRLVNNAGITQKAQFGSMPHDDWQRVMDVNVWSAASLAQAFTPLWVDRPGAAIVNMSSRTRVAGGPIPYATSKAAIVGLTRSLAGEVGKHDVRVNAVAPSTVMSPLVAECHGDRLEEHLEHARKLSLLPRLATPQDVAEAVAFLASSQANFITGEILHVCGGAQLAPLG